jgi:molybdopterin-binding protein
MKKIYTLSIAILLSAFVFNNKAFATTYYSLAGAGSLGLTAQWGTNTDGSGTHPLNFNTPGDVFNIRNRANATIPSAWAMSATNTVVIGDGLTAITCSLTPIGQIQASKVDIASLATLYISRSTNYMTGTFNNLDVNSTVIYNVGGAQILTGSFGNLTIKQNATLLGALGINNALNITAGKILTLNSNAITISGTIIGTGQIASTNTCDLSFTGSIPGNIGTLYLSGATPTVRSMNIAFGDPTAYVTLGTDVLVQDDGTFQSYFNNSTGSINLNGKTLTIDPTADANFPVASTDGSIMGSSSSSLLLNGTIGAFGGGTALYMDAVANTLKVLSINSADPLNLGNALNITDSLSISGSTFKTVGFLTLKSTNTLKGRVAEIKSGGSIIGDITVETFAKAGFTGWTNLGPSGVGGLTISSWDGQIPMSCAGCINDANSAGGYFVSVQGDPIGDGTYTELTGSTPLNPGTGYWVYLGNGQTTTTDMVWTVTGPIVTGSKGSGTGFISNPYPSPISLPRLQTDNPGMGAIYVFNPDNGTFTTFNGGIPSNGVIPMGQGFYITAGASINFLESHKVSYNTSANPLLKTTTPSSYIGSVFQLQVQGANGDLDNTYLRFHGNATPGFDIDLDGYKKFASPGYLGYPGPYSKYTTISTKVGTADYSINSLPYANTSNAVIPVMVKVSATGTYSIIPIDIANLPSGACVTLKDKLLNVTHDLRNGAYVCSINDTTSTARFELTICADVTAGISSLSVDQNTTLINQDINGAYVKTSFETNTKATISAYNVMGQRLMADKEIEGKDLTTYLDLGDVHGQVVIIRVTTAKTSTTKKIFIN